MILEELPCVRDHLQAILTTVDLHQATQTIAVLHQEACLQAKEEDHHPVTLKIEVQVVQVAQVVHQVNQVLKAKEAVNLAALATCLVINEIEC
jgi:pterin-4a-carbinolamine dehydratase